MINRKFRNKSSCWLTPDILESDAYWSLTSANAVRFLSRFHQKAFRKKPKGNGKRGGYQITNNGEIIFTYSEAKELGVKSDRSISRAFKELINKGFIDISEPGNWYLKEPTKFAISFRWQKYGTDEYEPPKQKHALPG